MQQKLPKFTISVGSRSRPQQKGSSVGTGGSRRAPGRTGPASPRRSRGRQLPSVTLSGAVAHRHRVWGGPHLQAGEMHVLYDAARAGHDLLLQEQAAQLQRRQPDLPVCGAHGGQPRTARATYPSTVSGLTLRLMGRLADGRTAQSPRHPAGTERECHMPILSPVNYNEISPSKLHVPNTALQSLRWERGRRKKGTLAIMTEGLESGHLWLLCLSSFPSLLQG